MKTKQIMNTGQMVRRGQIGKLPGGGAKGENCQGGKQGQKSAQGGHCPIAIVRPWHCSYDQQLNSRSRNLRLFLLASNSYQTKPV